MLLTCLIDGAGRSATYGNERQIENYVNLSVIKRSYCFKYPLASSVFVHGNFGGGFGLVSNLIQMHWQHVCTSNMKYIQDSRM